MKTHWKKTVDKDWIGTYILPDGKPIIVKLLKVLYEEVKVKGVKGKYKVAYFEKNKHFDKPMLLSANKNLERLSHLVDSPYIEDWSDINIYVTLQQEMDKSFGGGKDWALRIAPNHPQIKTTEDFPKEKELLDNCKTLVELQEVYTGLSRELQQLFKDLKDTLKTKLK